MASADPESTTETLMEELLRSNALLLRRLRAEANPNELTWSQLAIMGRLFREGPATTADLARAEGVKPQSMGTTLTGLERDGLVERTAHPTDGRQFLYNLTEAGIEARARHQVLKRAWLASALAKLGTQEKESLHTALQVIRRLSES